MNNFPKVFIIVLNYNGKDTIIECLKSVYQTDYPNYELVVTDNDSQDGSFELARNYFSGAHFIKNEKNIGFAAGNNVAIRFALERFADYIFLLNNDALIEKDILLKLVEAAEKDEKAGIASPVIFNGDNHIWFAGGKIKWLKMKATHLFDKLSDVPYETGYASGCAMLIKKEVFREIGLFDERYFLYYEDADFCLRARRKGFKSFVVPSARVIHYEKSENNLDNKIYWLVLSGLIFFKKNAPSIFRPWINFYLILRRIKNWLDVKIKKDNISKTVQKAYRDYKKISNI